MITLTDKTVYNLASFSITSLDDVNKLPKNNKYATGSTAILYELTGNIRIWNFVANSNENLDGQWVEMI